MNELEQQLLTAEVGSTKPTLTMKTRGRVDAGKWWQRTPLWVCVVGDDLVILAVARRRFIARVPLAECRQSHYQPATGEFVIEPGEGLGFNRFQVSPREAIRLAEAIKLKVLIQNS